MTPRWLRKLAYRFGYDIAVRRLPQYDTLRRELRAPRDMEPEFLELYEKAAPFTMTSVERMYALHAAVRHVVTRDIPGDFVECGVWRGGSAMMIALTLARLGATSRRLHLFDTFAGMTRPEDVDRRGKDGSEQVSRWQHFQLDGHNEWAYAPLDEVKANMATTGLPAEAVVYVEGAVEETLPASAPEAIALLRLDTDWYRSTHHELTHLYPRLATGGVLIVDDYGSFEGAKKAVDDYFAASGGAPLLHRIDTAGRLAVREG
jgi:hypothetical protein